MPKYYVAGIAYYDNALQHQGIQQVEDDKKYGVPELKKFPMPDAAHVRSAIRFFNYITPKHERKLAAAILLRMREYGLTFDDISVSPVNRFYKYIPKNQNGSK